MTSYLRDWFTAIPSSYSSSSSEDRSLDIPTITATSPPPASDDDNETETEDDRPPMFPSPFSAQRVSLLPRVLTDSELMPPPPAPSLATRQPGNLLTVPKSATLAPLGTTLRPNRPSKKVALAPGHSPLDWANIKTSGEDLRGVDSLMRIPPSVLKTHNKRDDAWAAFNGKVYNITRYLPFHPGGERELMRAAGRDGTKLFLSTHSWVNIEYMLDACLVGFLVSEPSS